jgi:5-methylcytosine-specific restriction protein A
MQELLDVLQNFKSSKAVLFGKAIKTGAPDHNSILVALPNIFRSLLEKINRLSEFNVEGSIGAGNMASVPWVGIFNRKITETAQNGYYIVLLFSEDMSSCFLTLNQGVTAFEKEYSSNVALQRMTAIGEQALRQFTSDIKAHTGPINLKATGHLGKGYQRGAIESYRYDAASLPNRSTLEDNFLTLLNHYDTLFSIAGITLNTLVPVTEAQYQQAAIERATPGTSKKKTEYTEPAGALPVPQISSSKVSSSFQRKPAPAGAAIGIANFKCEISPLHKTFISTAKNLPYVEAHHLIPISKQANFPKSSLDVTANIVALCPLCHKLLHHGKKSDKKKYLSTLLSVRKERLKEKGILMDDVTLLSY